MWEETAHGRAAGGFSVSAAFQDLRRGRQELVRGAFVAKRYEVQRLLGSGATGEVWEAEDLATDRAVALKKLKAGRVSPDLQARFRREAEVMSRIQSEHVARFLDLLLDDAFGAVLVLEKVEGEPLSDVLKRRRLSVEEAIDLGIDLLSGVADLHRAEVVHRDLKPANILVRRAADGSRRAVIVDLGASRLLASERLDEDEDITVITRGPMVIGTLAYLAPEQLIDSSAVTPAADLYAVGAVLHRAVAGVCPFGGLDDMAMMAAKRTEDAPMLVTGRTDERAAAFEELLATALKRRSAERFLTAEDMRQALEAARTAPGADHDLVTSDPPAPEADPESQLETLRRAPIALPQARRAGAGRPWRLAAFASALTLALALLAGGVSLPGERLVAPRAPERVHREEPSVAEPEEAPAPALPESAAAPLPVSPGSSRPVARPTVRLPSPRASASATSVEQPRDLPEPDLVQPETEASGRTDPPREAHLEPLR